MAGEKKARPPKKSTTKFASPLAGTKVQFEVQLRLPALIREWNYGKKFFLWNLLAKIRLWWKF